MSENFLLIVEDELEIAELIEFHARRDGFETKVVHSGRTALEVISRDRPDLVILDLMLPDVDGLEVLRRVRRLEAGSDTPILVVSAKGDESDVVAGIELGADDYVTKPFSPRILMARIRNLLRRKDPEVEARKDDPDAFTLCGGMLVIDPGRHVVTLANVPIVLTLTEFSMLQYLAARPGFVRTREQIISAVHGRSTVLSSRTVDVHVTALRRKLGEFGDRIETVRGVGYRFAEAAERTLGD
ncbi:MAG: response regulator transcription factor [Phycisphaerales bacterium]|nr:response regulator transcription factor [Phycisphaerales bacterium]